MSSSHFRSAPNAFSSLTAMSGDRADLPLRKFDRAGLPMPSRLEQFLFGCSVSARSEPTVDVRCGDGAQAVAERIVEGHDGPRLRLSQIRLELREHLLDRVQVRA